MGFIKKIFFSLILLNTKIVCIDKNKTNNTPKLNLLEIVKKQLNSCDQLKDPKKIQECREKLLLLALSQNLNVKPSEKLSQDKPTKPIGQNKPKPSTKPQQKPKSTPQTENQLPKQESDETGLILSNVANVVTSFGQLVIDPNNPQNVTQSLTNMIGGMINLISNMTRNKKLSNNEIDQIILKMDQDLKEQFVQLCIAEAMKVKKHHLVK